MKKIKKIFFVVLSFVVFLSVCVLPSFAWSYEIDGNGNLQTDNQIFEGDFDIGSGEANGDGYYQYIPFINGTIAPDNGRQWKDTLIRLEIFSNGNTAGTVYVTPTGSTDREWTYNAYARYYYLDGDFLETVFGEFEIHLALYNGQLYFSFWFANDRLAPYLTYSLSLSMDYEYLLREVVPDISDEQGAIINTLNGQISRLTNELRSKEEIIAGLQNNNVLDGAFSGIGSGFSAFVTPLLSLSVGGVTLGNVIGVLLIIGSILLFVLLINKIRGA